MLITKIKNCETRTDSGKVKGLVLIQMWPVVNFKKERLHRTSSQSGNYVPKQVMLTFVLLKPCQTNNFSF